MQKARKFYLVIIMADIDWDALLQQEKDEPLMGYKEDEPETLEETESREREEDAEFSSFADQNPQEFGWAYDQLEHIAFGAPELGTTVGGKFTKLEKILQIQTLGKEKLYTQKLKAELYQFFDSAAEINHYTTLIQNVPRFWTKNAAAMAATIFMIDELKGTKLTKEKLAVYSQQTGVRIEDLYRYYRLLKEYIE